MNVKNPDAVHPLINIVAHVPPGKRASRYPSPNSQLYHLFLASTGPSVSMHHRRGDSTSCDLLEGTHRLRSLSFTRTSNSQVRSQRPGGAIQCDIISRSSAAWSTAGWWSPVYPAALFLACLRTGPNRSHSPRRRPSDRLLCSALAVHTTHSTKLCVSRRRRRRLGYRLCRRLRAPEPPAPFLAGEHDNVRTRVYKSRHCGY